MKKLWLLGLSIINMAATAVYIACTPYPTVPIHWNIEGRADGFMSKWSALMLPAIALILGISHVVVKTVMEKKQDENVRYVDKIFLGMFLFATALSWLFVSLSMNRVTQLGGIVVSSVLMLMGAMFIFIGNLMPKIAQNGIVGVRTPATMSSGRVWRKTNKLVGYLLVACGLIWMVLAVVNVTTQREDAMLLLVGVVIVVVLGGIIPTIYAAAIKGKKG